jgi:two-component system chemotaxis sensor kinase CheA
MIFLPGFSTSATVTKLSGRGVGMDVVRSNIEALGGRVTVDTVAGRSTRFTIVVPLTLAIVNCLQVQANNQTFALPQNHLIEIMRVPEGGRGSLESLPGLLMIQHRRGLIPIVDLRAELLPGEEPPALGPRARIAILRANDQDYGLLLDAVLDYQEVVVKPLHPMIAPLPIFSGSTLLADGSVALILDVNALLRSLRLVPRASSAAKSDEVGRRGTPMLIFRVGEDCRMGVPLATVGRLEELKESDVQRLQDQEVFDHRGQLVPLIRLSRVLGLSDAAERASAFDPSTGEALIQVMLCRESERSLGLIVDDVIDVTEEEFELQKHEDKRGIYGSAILGGRAVDIIDLKSVTQLAQTLLLDAPGAGGLRL